MVVAHTFNTSTWEAEFRTDRATHRYIVSKGKKERPVRCFSRQKHLPPNQLKCCLVLNAPPLNLYFDLHSCLLLC